MMNEARCVVCEKFLDTNDSGAICYVTDITAIEPQPDAEEQLITYDRHMRTLTLCKEHWDKVERYIYAET